jgi:hypothetical protein
LLRNPSCLEAGQGLKNDSSALDLHALGLTIPLFISFQVMIMNDDQEKQFLEPPLELNDSSHIVSNLIINSKLITITAKSFLNNTIRISYFFYYFLVLEDTTERMIPATLFSTILE